MHQETAATTATAMLANGGMADRTATDDMTANAAIAKAGG
jgi:hypothetical protein